MIGCPATSPVRPEPVEGRLAQTGFDKLSPNGV